MFSSCTNSHKKLLNRDLLRRGDTDDLQNFPEGPREIETTFCNSDQEIGADIHEATSLRWSDVDFEKGSLTITDGERGTKNHEQRAIPMTDALKVLLLRLREEQKPEPADLIAQVNDTKNGIKAACRR